MHIPRFRKLRGFGIGVSHIVVLMIISGGFVAGTKAGLTYNTFPLMGDSFIPPAEALFSMSPWYINFVENIITIQFDHRMIAWLLMILVPVYWWKILKSEVSTRTRRIAHLLLLAFVGQITLGITTLLLVVPVPIAAAHQAGALVLLTLFILMNHEMRKPGKRTAGA
jgi:cytochrome c oxidase assembly protein subunit 15